MYVKILVDAQWCVDPASGPIIDLKKGETEYYDDKLAKELIKVGYAESATKKKTVEKPVEVEKPIEKPKPKAPKKTRKSFLKKLTKTDKIDE